MTMGEWIETVTSEAGIQGYLESQPYFMNIPSTSPYFTSVQEAVEWDILNTDYPFDPEAELTNEWAVYTLVHFAGFELNGRNTQIKDLAQSQFPDEMSCAVARGLITLNSKNRIYPKKIITSTDAEEMLDEVMTYCNNRVFEDTTNEVVWNDEPEYREVEPLVFNEQEMWLQIEDTSVSTGELIHFTDDGNDYWYRTGEIVQIGDSVRVMLENCDLSDITEEMDLSGTFTADLTKAVIIDSEDADTDATSYTDTTGAVPMSFSSLTRSFSVQDYTVSLSVSSSTVKAEIKRTFGSGMKIYATAGISGIKPSYKWKSKGNTIEDAYFRVDFTGTEKLGVSESISRTYYPDVKGKSAAECLASITSLFKTKKEIGDVTIPICTLQIPIPNAPLVKINAELSLVLYAGGKAEIVLTQKGAAGMEIRNGSLRMIHDLEPSSKAVIKANASVRAAISFGLMFGSIKLTNIAAETGAKANYSTTLHLYDNNGTHEAVNLDMPGDYAEGAASGNGDVLVCGDLNAYWLFDLKLNSSSTIAGKLGFSKTFHLLNQKNAPLLPGFGGHIENGQFVDHCTRKERNYVKDTAAPIDAEALQLASYHVIMSAGETYQISIKGLPAGYSKADLKYSSSNAACISVSDNGVLSGVKPGSAVIIVQTGDGKYSVRCSALVRSVETE